MSAVAHILLNEGCVVAGSDTRPSSLTSTLEKMGARISTRQDGSFVDIKYGYGGNFSGYF